MPPVRMRGDGRKAKNPGKTLLRLLGYMKPYLPTLGVVLLCIIANAVAQTAGSRSLWWTAISCLWCGMALRIFLPCGDISASLPASLRWA